MPNAAANAPPSAGPIARLRLKPMLFTAIAAGRSCFGTSCGVTACQAGAVNAPKALISNVNRRRTAAVTRLSETSTAKTAAIAVLAASPIIRKRRRSMISASAPAGMASRKIGRLAATCTSETIIGSGLRLVISQLDAAVYIHVPVFAARLAVQITVKAGWRNGLQAEARGGGAAGRVSPPPAPGVYFANAAGGGGGWKV